VIFHLLEKLSSCVVSVENCCAKDDTSVLESSVDLGSYSFSDDTGMLLKFTVSAREIKVIANVALSSGSSQQGNARLAAVAWYQTNGSDN
jgi:hypothetical protein